MQHYIHFTLLYTTDQTWDKETSPLSLLS